MSAERKQLRADLLAAVETAAAGLDVLPETRVISAWSQNLDPRSLPVIGIAVPSEQRATLAEDADEQDFRAIVVVKILHDGTDDAATEDLLDDIAESLAGPIEAALVTPVRDAALQSSTIEISGTGSPRVGTLTLTFRAQTMRGRTRP